MCVGAGACVLATHTLMCTSRGVLKVATDAFYSLKLDTNIQYRHKFSHPALETVRTPVNSWITSNLSACKGPNQSHHGRHVLLIGNPIKVRANLVSAWTQKSNWSTWAKSLLRREWAISHQVSESNSRVQPAFRERAFISVACLSLGVIDVHGFGFPGGMFWWRSTQPWTVTWIPRVLTVFH